MTNEQTRIIKEILENEGLYLSMADTEEKKLSLYYSTFKNAFNKYQRDLNLEVIARAGQINAQKTAKIDPYIAGGAAHGVAGVGAGVYTALKADERNKQIDAYRTYYRDKVFETSAATSLSEKKLLEEAKDIDALLNSIEVIREYRLAKTEELYQHALKLLKGGSVDTLTAHKTFLSLGNYKDSAQMAERSLQANNNSLGKEVFITSAIVSLFIGLFGLPGGLEGYLGVFCCSFLVCSVYIGIFAWKNRIK